MKLVVDNKNKKALGKELKTVKVGRSIWRHREVDNTYHKPSLIFYADLFHAVSHSWFSILKKIGRRVVVNTYPINPEVEKNQVALNKLLKHLKITPNLELDAPKGLDHLTTALYYYEELLKQADTASEKRAYKSKIKECERLIKCTK